MKTWTPLTPSRPGDALSSLLKGTTISAAAGHGSAIKLPPPTLGAWIGPLPESIHLCIISFLPVPELPRLAKVSRAFGRLVASDEAWEGRCRSVGLKEKELAQGELTRSASFLGVGPPGESTRRAHGGSICVCVREGCPLRKWAQSVDRDRKLTWRALLRH